MSQAVTVGSVFGNVLVLRLSSTSSWSATDDPSNMVKVVVMFEDFITDDIRCVCVCVDGWVVYVHVCAVCVHNISTIIVNKCYMYQ